MKKIKITPFITWDTPSATSNANHSQRPSSSPSARHSSSSVFPGLQRLDTSASGKPPRPVSVPPSAAPRGGPTPLLSLKLSGPSFLDVVIRDRESKEPVYLIETIFDSTSIYRLNHSTSEATKVATLQWPTSITKSRQRSGRTVQIGDGAWRDTEEVLKFGPLGNIATRKFSIPHYPHSFKWKLIPGGHFYCSTAGAKGPFAILDSAVFNAPAKLSIFHSCLEDDEAASQENYKGIPVLLLDYLVVTAMLLTTEVQEWLDRPQSSAGTAQIPNVSANSVKKWLAIIHNTPLPTSPTITSSPGEGETPATSEVFDTSNANNFGTGSASAPPSALPIENPSSPSTPATSAHSSFFPPEEDVPPVPPLPAELPSQSSQQDPSMVHPFAHPYASTSTPNLNLRKTPTRSTHNALLSRTPSSRTSSRQLPKPPTPLSSQASSPPPQRSWISMETQHLHDLAISPPIPDGGERSPSPSSHSNSSGSSVSGSHRSHHRNSARSSLGRALPPALPPPSQSLPLPPKLAQELVNSAATSSHQQQQQHSATQRGPHGVTSPPIVAHPIHHGSSTLQAVNPDPLSAEEEEQIRDLTSQMVALNATSRYGAGGAYAYPSVVVPLASNEVPPGGHVDAGMVIMRDARTTTAYAETVYDVPPPAYDAIDFSLPNLRLTQRGR